MSKIRNKFSLEVRERAVRMVREHRADYGSEWAAMTSIAAKIGCTAETLRRWCREEASRRTGPAALAANDRDHLKVLEREVAEGYARRAKRTAVGQRDIAQSIGIFCAGVARPPRQNGDGVYRRSSRGNGYRADLPRTGGRPFLLARSRDAPCRSAAAFGACPAR